MKVLMFGWEFPPYISGGLGTACHGLTENLGRLGVEVVLVLPRAAAEAVRGQPQYVGVAETTGPAPLKAPAPAPVPAPAAPAPVAPPAPVPATSDTATPADALATPPVDTRPTIFTSPPSATLPPLRLAHHTQALLLTIDSPLQPYLTMATYPARRQQALDAAATRAATAPPAPPPASASVASAPAPAAPTVTQAPAAVPAVPPTTPATPAWQSFVAPAQAPVAAPPPVRAQRPTFTTVSVGYGADLLHEVSRYTYLGSAVGRSQDFDAIHAHDWMTFMAGVEAKLHSGKPLVVHVHSTEYDRNPDAPSRDIIGIERYGLQRADAIITVSWRTRELLLAKYGVDPTKVVVVHNAAVAPPPASPSSSASPSAPSLRSRSASSPSLRSGSAPVPSPQSPVPSSPSRPKTVLFLGRVTGQKGPEYFVEAARLVLQQLPQTRFVLAGAGDLLPAIIERVAGYRLQQHFHFTGFLQGADLEAMFAISDLYVMPSLAEPFGITALEAVRRGVPVIVSRQAGVNEVLHHVTQVDPTDVQDLSAKIIKMLTHSRQTQQQLVRGQRELASLTWEGAATQVLAVYHSLVRGQALALGTPPQPAVAAAPDDDDLPPAS